MSTVYVNGYSLSVEFSSKVIKIQNNSALKNMLSNTSNGSSNAAYELKQKYRSVMGSSIGISTNSLAVEILGHVYPDKVASAVEDIPGLGYLASKIISHTNVIDCGESSVDSNRWLWDTLGPFHSFIFGEIVG